jgi:4-oxalocrotonate tautomerase
MPVLKLHIAPLQNPEQYARLASALTHITERVLHKDAALTAVLIDDLPAARWYIGAQAVQQPTALLEISVTQGTNTAAEKAQWIAEAFAELAKQLGLGAGLAPASYCVVRELPASDWGYGGLTQAQRRGGPFAESNQHLACEYVD